MLRFISLAVFLLADLAASTSVVAASNGLRKSAGANFISSLQFKLTFRICNAYPYSYPMDVYQGKEKLFSQLPYKQCGESASSEMKAGDKIDFKVGDSTAGSFTVSELPSNDAVLMLVIFRHDTLSTAVKFESHVFSNLLNAQIAVLDTYQGKAKAIPRIQDTAQHTEENHPQRSEELRYNSVVAVNQGVYNVILEEDGSEKSKHRLVALNRESYVVVRCGVESERGQAYPQELMVFPESDASALGGAATYSLFAAALATLFSVVVSL